MMTAFLLAWQATFLDVAMKSLLLFLIAGIAVSLLRRASASLRHLLWQLLFFSLLALPLLSLALPVWRVPLWQSPPPALPAPAMSLPSLPQVSAPPAPASGPTPAASAPAVPPAAMPSPSSVPPTMSATAPPAPVMSPPGETLWRRWSVWAFGLWLLGSLVVLSRTLSGLLAVWNLGRSGQRVSSERLTTQTAQLTREVGCKRPITLLTAPHLPAVVPMTWGALHPVILLPQEAEQWTDERLRAVLLHELAHIQRSDWLTQLLVQVTCALYWFHPLVWWAAHRLQMEGERACDDRVLALGIKPSDYARHLLEVVRTMKSENNPCNGTVTMAQSPQIEGRLHAILDERRSRQRMSRPLVATLILAALGVLLPLAALRVGARTPLPTHRQPVEHATVSAPETAMPEVAMPGTDPGSPMEAEPLTLSSTLTPPENVAGRLASFGSSLATAPPTPKRAELAGVAWGQVQDGLQTGMRLASERRRFALGERVPLTLYIRNVSDKEIAFTWTLNAYDEEKPTVEAIKVPGLSGEQKVIGALLTGLPSEISLILKPGEAMRFDHPGLVLGKMDARGLGDIPYLENPKPGLYSITQYVPYAIRPIKDVQELIDKVEQGKAHVLLASYQASIVSRDDKIYEGKGVVSPRHLPQPGHPILQNQPHPEALLTKPVEFEFGEKGAASAPAKADGEPKSDPDKTSWGKPEDGLQAGLYVTGGKRLYRFGETIVFGLKLRNINEKPITLSLQVPTIKSIRLTDPDAFRLYAFSGRSAPFTLQPGEEKAVPGAVWNYVIKTPGWKGPAIDAQPTFAALLLQPGKYNVSAPENLLKEVSANSWEALRAAPGKLQIEIVAGNAPNARLGQSRKLSDPKGATGSISWGKPINGLQAGIGFVGGKNRYRVGEEVRAELYYRNVSDRPLSFIGMMSTFNADSVLVTDMTGNPIRLDNTVYDLIAPSLPQIFPPGETVKMGSPRFYILPEGRAQDNKEAVLIAGPGRYHMKMARDERPEGIKDFTTLLATSTLEFDVVGK